MRVIWIHLVATYRKLSTGRLGGPHEAYGRFSGAAHDILAAAAGLPPTPDPAIRKLQKSVQGYCRHPPWGDLYESGLAL